MTGSPRLRLAMTKKGGATDCSRCSRHATVQTARCLFLQAIVSNQWVLIHTATKIKPTARVD